VDHCPLNNKPCPNSKNITISKLVDGKIEQITLCQNCAFNNNHDPLSPPDISGILEMIDGIIENKNIRCQSCKLNFNEITRSSRYGCADCYRTFRRQSINIFSKYQTGNFHKGKIPKTWEKKFLSQNISIQLALLEEQLKMAIENEQYEDAAAIQKKIKAVKENHEI
jgi:protein arginine kinase activator